MPEYRPKASRFVLFKHDAKNAVRVLTLTFLFPALVFLLDACSVLAGSAVTGNETASLPCRCVGPWHVGDAAVSVMRELGPVAQTIDQGEMTFFVFLLPSGGLDLAAWPHLILGVKWGKVVLLQLRGNAPPDRDLDLSGIHLGDSSQTVHDTLGKPGIVRPVTDRAEAELWLYPPQPIAFEIVNGRVQSMSVH